MTKTTDFQISDYNSSYKEELNSWQEVEKALNQDGLSRFVGCEDVKLGDYVDYITTEMNITSKIVLESGQIVGFVSYIIKNDSSAYVEIIGKNPTSETKGFAKKVLEELKNIMLPQGVKKITFRVNKKNLIGLKSFSKFAQENKELTNENYVGFEF